MSEDARTATYETRHADEAAAATVAAALSPDNTPQMHTEVDGDRVRTRIERPTTGGLHASADDYLVNVAVADAVVANARRDTSDTDDSGDTGTEATDETSDSDDSDDSSDTTDTNTHE